jgi:DNA-binding response OmpR family regulator
MKKILIAEDEKPMAKALELKLNNSGFEAKAVFNGVEAVAELEKTNYDLVLLDIMMPKKDGFGVLEDIKAKKIKTKVIVATNLSQENDIKKAKELGAIDYFVKSDTPISQVVKNVQKVLG